MKKETTMTMKRILLTGLVLAAWGWHPRPAWAFSTTLRVAGADQQVCSGCGTVTENAGGKKMTVKQIPSTGGSVIVWSRMPDEISTANIHVEMTRFTPEVSDGGNFCELVCAGIIRDGQPLSGLNLLNCFPVQTGALVEPQWNMMEEVFGNIAVIDPLDTNGDTCSSNLSTCKGSVLGVLLFRLASGSCVPTGSANLIDYYSLTIDFDRP
jgi:hypothetical protein